MIITIVHVQVKPEYIDDFIQITAKNHHLSVKEPGNLRFDVLQICYNLINQLACDHSRQCRGIAALAKQHGMGVVTMRTATSGFLQKLLAREFGSAINTEAVTRMCINYVLSTPEIDIALVGMRNQREVELNVDLADDVQARYDLDELHNRFRYPDSE